MGRFRRRNRRPEPEPPVAPAAKVEGVAKAMKAHKVVAPPAPAPVLKPIYVTMREPWGAEVKAPVLPLDVAQPWEAIPGPAIALEAPQPSDHLVPESRDPQQLVLAPTDADDGEMSETEIEAELLAIAELEALTEAAGSDGHASDVAAALVARALEDLPPEVLAEVDPEPAPPPPPEPDPIEVAFQEAQESARAGRNDEAKTRYRQLLGQRPDHVRARNNLALLLDAAGDHAGALAELDRALDVEAENATLLVNRGALLGQMGRFAAAERDLKRVLRVEPLHAEALFNLGVVMTKKGLWGEAVPHLRRAIELEPDRATAHFYLGEALNHVDDLPGAMLAYQRAAEIQPSYSRALYGLGIVYDRLGRPDDAANMYKRSREVARR